MVVGKEAVREGLDNIDNGKAQSNNKSHQGVMTIPLK